MRRLKHRFYLLYRLQQRLAITEGELRAMWVLLMFLLVGTIVRSYQEHHLPFDDDIYAEADSIFLAATARLRDSTSQEISTSEKDTTETEGSVEHVENLQTLFAAAGKINLNTSTQQELEKLPRIGPAMAARIIAYRTRYGPFRTEKDLLKVKGIGEKTLERLKDHITFD